MPAARYEATTRQHFQSDLKGPPPRTLAPPVKRLVRLKALRVLTGVLLLTGLGATLPPNGGVPAIALPACSSPKPPPICDDGPPDPPDDPPPAPPPSVPPTPSTPPNQLPVGWANWRTSPQKVEILGQAFDLDVDTPIYVRISVRPAIAPNLQTRVITVRAERPCKWDHPITYDCVDELIVLTPGWYTAEVEGIDANTGQLKRLQDGLFVFQIL